MEQQRFVRKNLNLVEAQQRQEKKRLRRKIFYVFLFIIISAVFIGVCFAVFLDIKEINVNGNSKYSYEEIVKYIDAKKGDNIYSFDAKDTEERMKQELPYIGKIEIKRKLPSTVEINIVEEMPYYITEIGGKQYILSTDLKVLEQQNNPDAESGKLAKLDVGNVRKCMVGSDIEFADPRTFDALNELYSCFENEVIEGKIKGVKAKTRFDIYINYDDRFKVYVGDMENADIKIKFLVSILDRLGKTAKGTIDVSEGNEAAVALS